MYEGRKHKLGEIVYSVVYNFLAKIVGFITTLLVSLKIGTTLDLDLYYLVTGLIGVVCGIIVTQESYYLVPKGLFIKTKLGFKSFTKYYNNVILIYTIILIVLAFLYLVFTLKLVELFSKYNIDQIRESKSLLKILAIYMFFTPINTLMGNILNSMNFFRISTFVTLISSLLTILCLIFFDDLGTTALYIGASLSSIGAFIYYILFLRSKGWEFSANFKRLKVEFTSDLLYANAMSFLAYFKGLINNYLISGLGRGVLTGFNFGYGLHNMPTFLILSQIKIPFSIKISQLFHEKKLTELNEYIISVLLLLIYITVPLNLIFFTYSEKIVQLIYGHGKFDEETLNSISEVFGNLSFTIPLSVFESFLFQIFISFNGLQQISKYTYVNNISLLVLNYLGLLYLGLPGFAYSMVLMYLIMSLYLIYFVNDRYNFIRLWVVFLQYIILFFVSSALILLTYNICSKFNFLNEFVNLSFSVFVYLLAYVLVLYVFNIGGKIRPFIHLLFQSK